MTAELDAATIARWWHDQSAAQGLPDAISDPAVIARVVTLALAPGPDPSGGRPAAKGGNGGP